MILVDDVIDTGLTMHYLVPHARAPQAGVARSVTLFDRPYRRLVDDLPVRYVGFTCPTSSSSATASSLDERWRNLPDLHLVRLKF